VQDVAGTRIVSDLPRARVPAGESLVVLTRDAALVETLRTLGNKHDLVAVKGESDLAAEIMGRQTGVAIIDAGAASSPLERLTESLKNQFPDLVLIVAGRLDDQTALAAQITSGSVYRFLHKPVSEQRVKLFVEAAWKRHTAEMQGDDFTRTRVLADTDPPFNGTTLWVGASVLAAALSVGGWYMTRSPAIKQTSTQADVAPTTVRDEQLEGLLARADAALAAGVLVAPPGEGAATLYEQAVHRSPTDPRGAAGVEKVIDKLLSAAEASMAAQSLNKAQKLIEQARAIKPDHVRVAFLTIQIGKQRERAVLAQARQAAVSGNLEQALAVLDGADKDDKRSGLIAEERQQLEQKELEERIAGFLAKAADRMNRGEWVEPAQDNARFFIESARAIAPARQPEIDQAERQLHEALIGEVHKALAAGNADAAQHWIDVAADAGISRDELAELTKEAQRVQTTAKADAMARLALLFNQRLTQGRICDPPNDSAKFYLAQLAQADATHPSTVLARQALAARTLEEAKAAVGRQDYAGAQRWLAEARDAGADPANINAIEHDLTVAQDTAKREAESRQAASRKSEPLNAGDFERVYYSPPTFPLAARERGVSGWVDLQFVVTANGQVAEVVITGAEPAGLFEQAAVDALKKWRYKPIQRDGQPVDQRARLRMKFALDTR
jgi:TonB family protein